MCLSAVSSVLEKLKKVNQEHFMEENELRHTERELIQRLCASLGVDVIHLEDECKKLMHHKQETADNAMITKLCDLLMVSTVDAIIPAVTTLQQAIMSK